VTVAVRDARREDLPAVVRLLADDPLGATREHFAEPLPQAYHDAFDAMARQGGNLLLIAAPKGRASGSATLAAHLPQPRSSEALHAIPDGRYLSQVPLRVFRAVLKHSLMDAE